MPDWYEGDPYIVGCSSGDNTAYEIRRLREELAENRRPRRTEQEQIRYRNSIRAHWAKRAREARYEAIDIRNQLNLLSKISAPEFVWSRPWTIFTKWRHEATVRELDERAKSCERFANLCSHWSTIGAE